MKKIGILLPCYNEKENIREIAEDIISVFKTDLQDYDYKIVFIDNASTDGTIDILEELCETNPRIGAIINARNFNYYSSWYGIKNTPGDCVIQIPSDRQVPASVISEMVHEWEKGHDFVGAIKNASRESRIMWIKRQIYYCINSIFSDLEESMNNLVATLYSRELLDRCIETNDPLMFKNLRVFALKYSKSISKIYIVQEKRKKGKSKNNRKNLMKIGMKRIVENSTSIPLYMFTLGMLLLAISVVSLVAYVIAACIIIGIDTIDLSMIVVLVTNLFLGAFFCLSGLMGEYVLSINDRCANWPGVIERKRINLE